MKFRTKIILSFSFIAFALSSILGIVHYHYTSEGLINAGKKNLELVAGQMNVRLTESLDSMKQVSDYILSDMDMLNAMQLLPVLHGKQNEHEIEKKLELLQSGISTSYIIKNYYRVVIFNEFGDIVNSANYSGMQVKDELESVDIGWLDEVDEKKGKPMLLGPHKDGWGIKKPETVFSLVRKVWGGNFGYIGVQRKVSVLEDIFKSPNNDIQAIAILPDGSYLYCSPSGKDAKKLVEHCETEDDTGVHREKINNREMLLVSDTIDRYGIRVIISQNMDNLLSELKNTMALALVISAGCFLVFMVMIFIISNRLTRPIVKLKEQMENTGIENLDETPLIPGIDDEVEALSKAYRQLMTRLDEAIVKEKRLSLLQLQAQFDTLQAQVNPHFLYNVLNVISRRGIASGDEEICEICGSLAAMLRYSTNNRERYATVREEVEYLNKYIFLLKSRYGHRLEVNIECAPELEYEIMPKIVLQQLVENSIQHGFNNSRSVMRISVKGWANEKGWFFRVCDNGEGITDEVKRELEEKMERIKNQILRKRTNIEMEIGGMGIANTFARMFLLYAERTVFRMENREEGFSVTIGVEKESEE